MEQYKFDVIQSKMIVEAIVEGYREYIELRKERNEKMKISSAFAWTKGNFIENKIAEACVDHNISYHKAKAGLTWDYLQFIHLDTQKLFLIKNAAYFNQDNYSQALLPNKNKSQRGRRTYLHELSKINEHLDFPPTPKQQERTDEHSIQLSLFIPENQIRTELTHLKSLYTEFHILTYSIDEAFQISNVMHYLPNPNNNIAYEIEDLSAYISGADITNEERSILAPDLEYETDAGAYDIGIIGDEERK
ncbi:spr1630 family ClpXP-sensitive toxin [Pontibacillus litoralis]|uniref:Uncharacterized protein n=1 Tax=Pontibacillus litoralis JSM 072002 TaxID=1385512 RepID=A0A0A5G235_9BACI|nr:hypothetical protein [Pontibacillus litoralis]KGX86084.1 hypothetical protein N784_05850 [Pontibacillus litoralis JSM 072002]